MRWQILLNTQKIAILLLDKVDIYVASFLNFCEILFKIELESSLSLCQSDKNLCQFPEARKQRRNYLNIPYLRFALRSAGQWLSTWQAGHVAGTSYTSNQPPVETTLLRLRPSRGRSAQVGEACEHFTFYFHAVLTPMYATSLTYSPDIAFWHVLPTQSIFILHENENLSAFLK